MHYIDLAGISLIPEHWHNFKFFKSKRLIKAVRLIIILVAAHLNGLDLQEFIPLLSRGLSGLLHQSPSDPVTVVFLQNAHDGQLHRCLTGFLQAQEAENKKLMEGYFKNVRSGIGKERTSLNAAYSYMQAQRGMGGAESLYMDSKK